VGIGVSGASVPSGATLFGGGSTSLVLDARQVEEVLLTANQTLMGVAILLALRFPRWAAYTLFGLFAVQFVIPGLYGRLVLSAVYAGVALALLVVHRHQIIPDVDRPVPLRAAGGGDRADAGTGPRRLATASHLDSSCRTEIARSIRRGPRHAGHRRSARIRLCDSRFSGSVVRYQVALVVQGDRDGVEDLEGVYSLGLGVAEAD
jgi:hypothetical protein